MEEHGIFHRRRLPHWELPGAAYFVTACLAGSIPAEGLLEISVFRSGLKKRGIAQGPSKAASDVQLWKKSFARADWWLDRRPASRHLAHHELARTVVDACYYWAGQRYDLLAYVVMPSHFHWVFRPIVEELGNSIVGQVAKLPYNSKAYEPSDSRQVNNLLHDRSPRERIMHTLKRHTARECNRMLGRTGVFWQDESYDHCVRDDDELERIIEYVENNPVKAGLARQPQQWNFSSAHDRVEFGLLLGQPLMRHGG